ncbi:hypothetical protein ACC792_31975 [Rhizobium ruizarguesonis]
MAYAGRKTRYLTNTYGLPSDISASISFISQSLTSFSVQYLFVGGIALAIHGIKRQFRDIDIWISTDEKNSRAFIDFLDALPHSYFGFNASSLFPNGYLDECVHILRLLNDQKIDFRLRCDGSEFEACYQRAVWCNYNLPISSLSDLIVMKRIGSQRRAIDRADMAAFQAIKNMEGVMAGPRVSNLKNGEIAIYDAGRGELVIISASGKQQWSTSKQSIDDAIAIADAGHGYRVDRSKLRTLLEAMGSSVLLS